MARGRDREQLKEDNADMAFTIIEDTREQTPLDFAPYAAYGITVERRKRRTGDYTIKGFERDVFIERKSLPDCVGTLTHGRDRFTREIYDRAAFARARLMVVEANWNEISSPYKFSRANPESIVNSLMALQMPPTDIHVFAARSRSLIAWYIVRFCSMYIHRVTNGSSGMWRAIFARDSADLAPYDDVPKTITANYELGKARL